jgi:hypothetical protein
MPNEKPVAAFRAERKKKVGSPDLFVLLRMYLGKAIVEMQYILTILFHYKPIITLGYSLRGPDFISTKSRGKSNPDTAR